MSRQLSASQQSRGILSDRHSGFNSMQMDPLRTGLAPAYLSTEEHTALMLTLWQPTARVYLQRALQTTTVLLGFEEQTVPLPCQESKAASTQGLEEGCQTEPTCVLHRLVLRRHRDPHKPIATRLRHHGVVLY